MKLRHILNIIIASALSLIFTHCANIGSPSGGIKDEIPPVVMHTKPAAGALDVMPDEISIKFDEIVVLKNLNEFFLVSPPMNEKPVVKAYGKELTVEFEDTLQDNVVYTIYFGDAIVDNNEGNPMLDYSYSFSTGSVLDTMRLQGHVLDAKTLTPEKGIIVGIYSDFEDSLFISNVPMRIAKTDENGYFSVNNVRPGTYIVRAIADMANDYKFNQGGEKIAFSDVRYETTQKTVTLMDSIFEDSIGEDKVVYPIFKEMQPRDTIMYLPDDILLMAFTEEQFFQTLTKKERKFEERLDFQFMSPIKDMPKIRLLDDQERDDWYLTEIGGDSSVCYYWVKDSALVASDTIEVIFDYQKTDTLSQLVWQTDTMVMHFKHVRPSAKQQKKDEKKAERKADKKKDAKVEKVVVVPVGLDISAKSSVNYFDDILITAKQPLARIDAKDFRLYEEINDSTVKQLQFKFYKDEEAARTYRIEYNWNQEMKYQLAVDSAKIYDIYGKTNDSIGYKFSIVPEEDFSAIFLNMSGLKKNAVVQLMDAQGKVEQELSIDNSEQEVGFYYLKPSKYYVSLFYDDNNNGIWDTGKYGEKRQPEEVRFFNKMIETKAYYEMEEDWNVESMPLLEQMPDGFTPKKDDKKK